MAALTLASPSFLSSGIERLRSSGPTAKNSALKSVTTVTASCRPTWQRPIGSQRFNRARQAAAMAATWQAMGCQPGMSFRTDPGTWWMEGAPRGKGGNPLEEIFRQLAGVKGCQVEEREDGWVLRFELPGLSAKDVKVQVENERVLLVAQPGRTTRVPLPGSCHVAGLQARLRCGLLTVSLPRTKPSRELRDVTLSGEEDDDVARASADVAVTSADVAMGKDDVAVTGADVTKDMARGSADVSGENSDIAEGEGKVESGKGEVEEGKRTDGGLE